MKKELKVQAEIYSRVVGYFRPVNQWNRGKREEFSQRLEYRMDTFINELNYSCDEYKRAV
jgi:ribonucleoside-triphosphate reductase